jgi:hypothetical protein
MLATDSHNGWVLCREVLDKINDSQPEDGEAQRVYNEEQDGLGIALFDLTALYYLTLSFWLGLHTPNSIYIPWGKM